MALRFLNNNVRFIFILAFILIPGRMFAQSDAREPGIYAVMGEEFISIDHTFGGSETNDVAYLNGAQTNPAVVRYRGVTSAVIASNTFVYVVDSEKTAVFSPFNRGMTPNDMRVLSLSVNDEKQQREYPLASKRLNELSGLDFEWEQLDDVTFEIHIPGLEPGEYGFVFRRAKFGPFDYTKIFCFTIPSEECGQIVSEREDHAH